VLQNLKIPENNKTTEIFKKYIAQKPNVQELEFDRYVCRNKELTLYVDQNVNRKHFYI